MSTKLPDAVVARARRAAEGFRASSRVLELLSSALPETDEVTELVALRDELGRAFDALTTSPPDTIEPEVRRLEAELPRLEHRLETLDARIPMGWFREHFDVTRASPVALADYAALLGRYLKDTSARLDRIQFLLTRLISLFVPTDEATHERRRSLLAEALPPIPTEDSIRRAALDFFASAGRRLDEVERVEQLVESGFFVDVFGYKLSLREQLLDPDVMAAAIELNGAISRCLRRVAEAGTTSDADLAAHLTDVEARVRATFQQLREDERPAQQRFEHWLAQNAAKRAEKAEKASAPLRARPTPSRAPRVSRRTVLAVATATLLGVALLLSPGERLSELSAEELTRLSPVLTAGVMSPRDQPRSFVGRVDGERWGAMKPEDKKRAAAGLAETLTARGLVSGTVLSEQEVVVRIEGGKVLLVQ